MTQIPIRTYRDGKLIHEEMTEVPEPEPMFDERISALETEIAEMRGRVNEVVASNAEVKAMRNAILGNP
jgi:hypothetical protein